MRKKHVTIYNNLSSVHQSVQNNVLYGTSKAEFFTTLTDKFEMKVKLFFFDRMSGEIFFMLCLLKKIIKNFVKKIRVFSQLK